MTNVLHFDRQVEVISALTEGVSIRATERLTDIHRDTIMRLGVRVGITDHIWTFGELVEAALNGAQLSNRRTA